MSMMGEKLMAGEPVDLGFDKKSKGKYDIELPAADTEESLESFLGKIVEPIVGTIISPLDDILTEDESSNGSHQTYADKLVEDCVVAIPSTKYF